jgi:hypothetical protein
MGVPRVCITVGNSKANGLVEVTIRVFKDVMRKYISEYPNAFWSDFVTHALMMMRFTTHRSHGLPPYTIVTGNKVPLPHILLNPDTESPSEMSTQSELTAA